MKMETTEINVENSTNTANNTANNTTNNVENNTADTANNVENTANNTNTPRVEIPETLNQQQALQVLVDAARIAQSKGLFTLDDAELVNKAIKAFVPPTGPVASNQ